MVDSSFVYIAFCKCLSIFDLVFLNIFIFMYRIVLLEICVCNILEGKIIFVSVSVCIFLECISSVSMCYKICASLQCLSSKIGFSRYQLTINNVFFSGKARHFPIFPIIHFLFRVFHGIYQYL